MVWLFAAFVLFLAVFSPGFRGLLLLLAGLGLVLLLVAWVYSSLESAKREREREFAKTLIPIVDVELLNETLQTESPYARLTGRVRNKNRRYTLTSIEMRFGISDCQQVEKPTCDIVGESTTTVSVSVPPGQVREFTDYVSFSGIGKRPPNLTRWWDSSIISVTGQ